MATITRVQNVGNGLDVDLTTSGAIAGAVTAVASRLPGDASADAAAVTAQGGGVYRVRVRSEATKVRLCYYVQLMDGGTPMTSYQIDATSALSDETCCWVCVGAPRDMMDQCERTVVDIILDNLQAVNASLEIAAGSTRFPSGAYAYVKNIHSGLPSHVKGAQYPRISVRTHSYEDDPYFANPRSDYCPIRTTVICYFVFQTDVNYEPLARAIGKGVMDVINQSHYIQVQLESGLYLNEFYALNGSSETRWDDSVDAWVSSFQIEVSCKVFLGRETA